MLENLYCCAVIVYNTKSTVCTFEFPCCLEHAHKNRNLEIKGFGFSIPRALIGVGIFIHSCSARLTTNFERHSSEEPKYMNIHSQLTLKRRPIDISYALDSASVHPEGTQKS